jgi:DNA-binding YbaB/EbfC family protein
LGNFSEIMKLLRLAQLAQSEAPRIREELTKLVVEGSAGGGMVKVSINGKLEILECKIDPQVVADNDAELLEDLVVAATNQAFQKVWAALAEKFGQVTAGIDMAGLKEMLQGLGVEPPKA